MTVLPPATDLWPDGRSRSALNLGQILGALSHALDLTEGQPPGHCVRSCWIGMQISAAIGVDAVQASDLYYMLLLKDLGCSSNAARICQLYLTDDLGFKRGYKTVDGSIRQALAFVMKHTGPGIDLTTRLRTIATVLRDSDEIAGELIETRCHQGAEIAAQMGFAPAVCDGIRSLDEHWDGRGRPAGLKGHEIPLFSRIALIAQVVDVFHQQAGRAAAMDEVRSRSGVWLDPDVTRAALSCGASPAFWSVLESPEIERRVFEAEPSRAGWTLDDARLDDVVHGFARVIDAKSPFTHGHSNRVALYNDLICAEMDYAEHDRRWLRRGALMHDIGKLGVSNKILDKPGKLTGEEFAIIKAHPAIGDRILRQVELFQPLAELAASHHERLDGAGYPGRRAAADLTQEMRILTVADIFDALTAERPYREAMPLEKTYAIMDGMRGMAIDGDCYAALQRAVAAADYLRFA